MIVKAARGQGMRPPIDLSDVCRTTPWAPPTFLITDTSNPHRENRSGPDQLRIR